MNGAARVLDYLTKQQQVTTIFGYPGGAIMPLYDALLDFPITHYLSRHEQGAGFAAIGYARTTGKTSVCVATSGPGATNVMTCLADAMLDSVPMVVITGQVARTSMGSDAFQEVDVVGLSVSVTKHTMLVAHPAELIPKLALAFKIAQDGRPGPVLIDIPKDILMMTESYFGEPPLPEHIKANTSDGAEPSSTKSAEVLAINHALGGSKKPLVYLGGGVAMADALPQLRKFVDTYQLPVVSTLKGLGTALPDYPLNLGMLGMHGLSVANQAVQSCDTLLVVGARLDDRATGKLDAFAPHAKIIHLDIDSAEIGKRLPTSLFSTRDLKTLLPSLSANGDYRQWCQHLLLIKQQKAFDYTPKQHIHAPVLLNTLSNAMAGQGVVSCDVGQHQMWVAQHVQFSHPYHHLTSGGLGTMGFGLPAAIGAKVAQPEKTVVAVCGDGSFMMNIQELATLKRYGIAVKIIILDNQRLGMVKQWQELFHQQRYSETDLSDNPEFSQVAQAFGITAAVISAEHEVKAAIDKMLGHAGPFLLHVRLDHRDNVWPIVPPNTANHEMMEE